MLRILDLPSCNENSMLKLNAVSLFKVVCSLPSTQFTQHVLCRLILEWAKIIRN